MRSNAKVSLFGERPSGKMRTSDQARNDVDPIWASSRAVHRASNLNVKNSKLQGGVKRIASFARPSSLNLQDWKQRLATRETIEATHVSSIWKPLTRRTKCQIGNGVRLNRPIHSNVSQVDITSSLTTRRSDSFPRSLSEARLGIFWIPPVDTRLLGRSIFFLFSAMLYIQILSKTSSQTWPVLSPNLLRRIAVWSTPRGFDPQDHQAMTKMATAAVKKASKPPLAS